jgi:CRISPR-associated protein Csd1
MLIKALCDYYDILAERGQVLPEGYSDVAIHYCVALTPEGKISEIIDIQEKETINIGKGKSKENFIPKHFLLPKRTEKPGIESNIIEHRPLYLFGLNIQAKDNKKEENDDGSLTQNALLLTSDSKASKSIDAFKKANLDFINGIDTPVVNAYRNFILNWKAKDEEKNEHLIALGKKYSKSGYVFCLSGEPDKLLEDDTQIKRKWENSFNQKTSENDIKSQCCVTGEIETIARIHRKIKGIYGGLATGTVLVGVNNPSESSYCLDQSYNSNVSEKAMQKYTETLNYLLREKSHREMLNDITVVFWAASKDDKYNDIASALIFNDTIDADETNQILISMMHDLRKGSINYKKILGEDDIDENVDFYIVGFEPNSSRLSLKFMYKRKFGEIFSNIAKHQIDIQIDEEARPIFLRRLDKELISPKASNDKVSPELQTKIFEAVLYGSEYPISLLQTIIKRVKTDTDIKINNVRAGFIKGYINRKDRLLKKEEEIKMALDLENKTPAYLCGRLFAVLEKLQQDASGGNLNRTIKDAYFASATSKPAIVFPKLLKLAQNHLNKVKSAKYYNILIEGIIDNLNDEFPDTLLLIDQGKFIIGYYQQMQNFYIKKKDNSGEENYDEYNKDENTAEAE